MNYFVYFLQTSLSRVNLPVFCVYRPYFIALRYSLGGNISWPPAPLQLTPNGVNNAVNISRYTDDVTPSLTCPTSTAVSLTLPELTPGMSGISRSAHFCFESML